ncbi:MAG: bifunctional UDP-N-acetylmuramoyl-tripeptide:D-alanyl-D-alanine ligase/alanine racemase [Prevotella sp.]|nr:bifunctional UDP-N-acetylmuramoyl-tripeptide:D-alanyl-D-alanine ligase/alanine racemase [Prevotella sp.]
MPYTIKEIAGMTGAELRGSQEGRVSFLLTDSRSLCFPEETLFFALRTKHGDGRRYMEDLYRRGVRHFVVDDRETAAEFSASHADAALLLVDDTRRALQRLARRHREKFDIPVVGITGSNGKTVVKEWLDQLLGSHVTVTRSPRSYNSQIGVPLSVWLLSSHTDIALIEAGISEVGEMQALADIIQPTIGVITSLGTAHQENFETMEEKCSEKLLLLKKASVVVYPADDSTIEKGISSVGCQGEHVAWSAENPEAALYINKVTRAEEHTTVGYSFKGTRGSYILPFIDEASVRNSFTCATVALQLGLTPDLLAEGMRGLAPVGMRLEVIEGRRGCTVINDSYSNDLNSLGIALDFMARRAEGKREVLILSDIDQSGEQPETLYSKVAALARKRGVAKFVGIGSGLMRYRRLIDIDEKYFFSTTKEFVESPIACDNEVVLLKGARRFGFEHIAELFIEKSHETVLEVNLNAVVDNLNCYRKMMAPDTKLVCMIKADAYGAGAVEIAKTLQDHRVDYLAVAVADEGVALRKAGITQNVMVMNPEMAALKTLFDYELEPEVYSFRLLEALIRAAEREGITNYPVHIKLDTGMHRLGFNVERRPDHCLTNGTEGTDCDEIGLLIDRLQRQNAIIPRSVFSHFVGSDNDDFDDFSALQFARFDQASRRLQAAFPHKILRHIDNSAGIEHFPECQLDMCRLGLGLYGINPRDNSVLNSVSTLKTTILQLRRVSAGESIGYSRRTVVNRESLIATIPIGYADGLDRRLGNRHGFCLVNGCQAPYVGNICMDVAMVDVTGIDCKEGDSVEIFGEHLPVTVLSGLLETIPYEVLTGVSGRVKRVYFA